MILERTRKTSPVKRILPGILIGAIFFAAAVWTYHASGNPGVCGACHSMKIVHNRWQASNHGQFACTECHLPDESLAGKIVYKTRAGLNDLIHETARDYGAAVGLSVEGRGIVNGNCVRCHASTIAGTGMAEGGTQCLKCHRYIVHGRGQDEGGIRVEN